MKYPAGMNELGRRNRAYASADPGGPSGPVVVQENRVSRVAEQGRPDVVFDREIDVEGFRIKHRELDDGAMHIAAMPPEGVRMPTYRELMSIKNRLAGDTRQAVLILPPSDEDVDDGQLNSATHIFVLPEGQELPYSIAPKEGV